MTPQPTPRAVLAALSVLAPVLLSHPAAAQCGETSTTAVAGTHNPFLAAQPRGRTSKGDVSPTHAPALVPVYVREGDVLRFSNVAGNAHHSGLGASPGPEGDVSAVVTLSGDLGISGGLFPLDGLVGVFLPVRANQGAAPPDADFSTPAARDYDLLQPQLYQLFYIGDGLKSDGTPQGVVAPQRAQKLFLAAADDRNWSNNVGAYTLDVTVDPRPVRSYCTPKMSSQGCLPTIGSTGTPDVNGPVDFVVHCTNVMPNRFGFLFYGYAQNNLPFQGGTLCVWQGLRRMRPKTSLGPGGVCKGVFSMDFDKYIRSGADPNLVVGAVIYAQWWMRDPQSPSRTGLSDALEIALCQ